MKRGVPPTSTQRCHPDANSDAPGDWHCKHAWVAVHTRSREKTKRGSNGVWTNHGAGPRGWQQVKRRKNIYIYRQRHSLFSSDGLLSLLLLFLYNSMEVAGTVGRIKRAQRCRGGSTRASRTVAAAFRPFYSSIRASKLLVGERVKAKRSRSKETPEPKLLPRPLLLEGGIMASEEDARLGRPPVAVVVVVEERPCDPIDSGVLLPEPSRDDGTRDGSESGTGEAEEEGDEGDEEEEEVASACRSSRFFDGGRGLFFSASR